ncbi:heterokaryon incompatibility protein-domain-containing protein [Dactylonectria macrodidyma]|uniref:Heterokaryon incompatibility protein-domain-containing protein n=1 Tax=Dactylonectria macrodidyma TaxID=307937 RepID=A0A9P9IB23_9HYPO|nr:heterokaryon incompatibility protein-domain-containing protein [Dactylonectria macrodidyma]
MRSCLQECVKNHSHCQQSEGSLPTRLLDVGHRGDGVVRLIESETITSAKYIALSYCWDNTVTIKTTVAGSEKMKLGLEVSELPKLGIPYLWIDALCIIQDCHEDWEEESVRMSKIYAKAHLTIAAASSESAAQAFFFVAALGPSQISITIVDESLLEVQWTCQEAVFCECRSRLNHRPEFGHKSIAQIMDAADAFSSGTRSSKSTPNGGLTDPKDKLPAISGIAEMVQQRANSSYAAGLWANNIDLDLLWRRATRTTELPRTEFIAPSFSWALIDDEVDYYCFQRS